jgi:creatinine amidohydrolase
MDLASQFGEQGFRWIFLVHDHGEPAHNRALDQASDYFNDAWGGVHGSPHGLKPLMKCCDVPSKVLTPAQLVEDGFTVHGGADETSQILFLRPDLVSPEIREAPSWTGKNYDDLYYALATKPNWPGYFGAPRHASSAMGAQEIRELARRINETALQILEGLDWRKIPRFANDMDPRDAEGEALSWSMNGSSNKNTSTG